MGAIGADVASSSARGEEDKAISASADAAEGRFRDIVDLLVAAGYFRARLAALSPFDRVIGGLSWCILNADMDVDVDVLFTEDSTIGAKIKLGEAIVKALRLMRCAYPLQSHQIRGLDYDALFPVIQWLVRRVMETREERGELIRSFSESHFARRGHELPEDVHRKSRRGESDRYVQSMLHRYRPVRKFRAATSAAGGQGGDGDDGAEAQQRAVRETLLEYGGRVKVLSAESASGSGTGGSGSGQGGPAGQGGAEPAPSVFGGAGIDDPDGNVARLLAAGAGDAPDSAATAEGRREAKDRERETRDALAEARAMEELLAQMDTLGDRAMRNALSASGVGQAVGRSAKAIRAMNEERAALQAQLEAIVASGEGGGAMRREAHRRQLASLRKQIATLEQMGAEVESEHAKACESRDEARKAAAKAAGYNDRVERETEKLSASETPENRRDIAMLTGLVMVNERLKEQEMEFRDSCKRQLGEWKALMAELEAEGGSGGGDTEEEQRMAEIEEAHKADAAKHSKVRQILAAKNRELAVLMRKIDDVPTRTELIQYERRFVELYEQVSSKTEETKKFFHRFNTLCDTKTYLTKETSILNSICDSISSLSSKKGAADKLLQSIDDILNSVRGNLEKIEARHASESERNAGLHEQYAELMEKQRAYYKAVSNFKEACFVNEKLLAELGE